MGCGSPSSPPPTAAPPEALELAEQLGLSFTVADVLVRRGYAADDRTKRFLDPKLAHLSQPAALAGWEAAVGRIAASIQRRESVVVFGDYDCDGITAAAILTEVIGRLGGKPYALLANRFDGGYGLSERAYQRVRERQPRLLVTCDCGSTDHARVARARADGVDVVVIDHHAVPAEPLGANAFINPHQPGCGFPFKGLASCGLALLVAAGLRKELDVELDLRAWLDLVAIGTVADVAPLQGDNRVLVRAGLTVLDRTERPGLRALSSRAARGRAQPATAETIAFQLAPRLNAPGRLGDPRPSLELLLASDAARAAELCEQIEGAVTERRRIQRSMVAEAIAEIAAERLEHDAGLVLARQDWHPGVVGIVAGRLAAQYRRPCVVVALEGETGRGSARAPAGFDLQESLRECADELLGFGGHRAAAGVELRTAGVSRFREQFAEVCARQRDQLGPTQAGPRAEVQLDERDDLMQVVADLERLEPCGEQNPAPRLRLAGAQVRRARPVQEHLKLDVEWSGRGLTGFAPGRAHHATEVEGQRVDLIGRLRRDHWRGGQAAELLVDGWE